MVEYLENQLCIQPRAIINMGIFSEAKYKQLVRGNRVNVMRRACRNTPALIEYDSLPDSIKIAIRGKVGDPRQLTSRNVLMELIKPDPKAMKYYTDYMLPDGRYLTDEVAMEYYTNATVLNAMHELLNNTRTFRRARGGGKTGTWEIVAHAVNTLDLSKIRHTLPSNERRLKDRYTQYQKNGYSSLIHKNYCNQNSRKVTEILERLIISIYCMNNKPYTEWVCDYYLQFIGGAIDIVDISTGVLFDREDFKNDKGEFIIVSEATVWNYINNPKNAAIIESLRMGRHRYISTIRPHVHRHAPNFALSKISLDDRDLPRKMHDGKRVKAYYAYDVASGALIGAAYSKTKDTSLFIDCVRDLFKFINANNWGMPLEIEVEHHLVSNFKDDIAKAGVLFPFVRFCAAGNSQEKHAEQLNRQKKYGYEKRYQDGIGRFYAKQEVNRTSGERVYSDDENKYLIKEKTYSFEKLVADDRETIASYNAGKHRDQKKYPNKSRLDVLQENINPNLADVNEATLARYIGECTKTSIVRNMYVQVSYAKYQLPNPEILKTLQPNNYNVQAYYIPESDGAISKVHLYQNDNYLGCANKIVKFNTSKAEQTEEDKAAMGTQFSYIKSFDGMIAQKKQELAKPVILPKTSHFNDIPEPVINTPIEEKEASFEDDLETILSNYNPDSIRTAAIASM